MVRKVTLTASEVGFANKNGIKLEDLDKSKLPKRGRPTGSKNKTKVDSFSETLKEWDRMENEVDFKDLCQKLQEALAKSYCEYEQLEQNVNYLRNELQARDVVIRYLESKIR